MEADIHTLYTSGFYRVIDFKCRCTDCRTSKPEYSASFSISYVRKGNFLFNVFRHALDSYSGCVLVTKPGYERTVTHTHEVPDECTIFDFRNDFHAALVDQYGNLPFFQNPDLHSTLIRITPEMEFLHHHILRLILTQAGSKLEIDNLVVEVIEKTLARVGDYTPDHRINLRLKKNHLVTIETAKAYIAENFINDISLLEIAYSAGVYVLMNLRFEEDHSNDYEKPVHTGFFKYWSRTISQWNCHINSTPPSPVAPC